MESSLRVWGITWISLVLAACSGRATWEPAPVEGHGVEPSPPPAVAPPSIPEKECSIALMRVLIENNQIHHINGTAPEFGIDIESLSYKSQDITIRGNTFHHNRGGDFVNTDGRNVLFENNTMEDGEGNQYVDGPVIYWSNTDQIIRGNHIYMAKGSANGKMGILEYSHMATRTNPTRNLIENNTLEDCSINLMYDSLVTVRKNRVTNGAYIFTEVEGLELVDNVLEKEGWSYSYMIYASKGSASGNTLNGKPYEIAMTPDAPFSNWDGQ